MDYKEKYEMALEGIQEILSSGEDSIKMSRLQLRLQGIFPELKESEDERIRKGIICGMYALKDQHKTCFASIPIDNVIAWLEKQGEHKPWSEEDEDILNTIINHFKVDIECTDEDDMVRWLKSIKDRVQPKQEWGEEDKKMLESCCGAIAAADYYTYDDKQEMESWLKSLRPQSTWKPSEEQLDSLRIAIGDEQGSDCCGMLRSLLKDLKSL